MSCRKLLPLSLLLLLAAGCATTPQPPQALLEAREAVAQAEEDPTVRQYAPTALEQAQQDLSRAEFAWCSVEERGDTEHWAFLAHRRAQIAQALAQREMALATGFAAVGPDDSELTRARSEAEMARREAERLQAQLRDAQQQLAELEPQQTERGIVLTLGEFLFPFDSAELQPGAERTLDRLAQYLRDNPDYLVLIEGHTDATGDAGYNQQLSERRADAVRAALAQRGIGRDRVRSVGLGEDYPVASNAQPEGRAQNRRVEVVIAEGQMPPTRDEVSPTLARERGASRGSG